MKVLFLDIDGVCNCRTSFHNPVNGWVVIDPEMAFRVGKIEMYTDCKVVLSSSWRFTPEGREAVEKRIVKLFAHTSLVAEETRGEEIDKWLKDYPQVTRYAILDDNTDFRKDQPLFKTDWEIGITDKIMNEVIAYLNAD